MSVYIPWMSMPKTCDDCQVSADCPNDEHIDGYNMQNRPRFCQLVPVPEFSDVGFDSDDVWKKIFTLVVLLLSDREKFDKLKDDMLADLEETQ